MNVESIECYIQNINTDTTVSFNVEIPESVEETVTANFDDQTPRGRSSPFKSYTNSGPHSISFTVTLCLDYRRNLKEVVEALKDMLKPAKSCVIIAPKVRVRIGNIINIKAVPLSFSFNWGNGYKNGVYRTCECSFSFDEVEDVGSFASSTGSYSAKALSNSKDSKANKEGNSVDYVVGKTYNLKKQTIGYFSADEALAGKSKGNPVGKYKPGEYYIFAKYKGAINITSNKEIPGAWIDPSKLK